MGVLDEVSGRWVGLGWLVAIENCEVIMCTDLGASVQ